MTYEPIIGLEIHVELKTKSGMFCGCPADHFGKIPNTGTCPVCLGLPGALPVPNKKAIEWTIMLGLALGSDIAEVSKFDRKHYFYPDLPKGYQISQYDQPLATGGMIKTSFGDVRIHRVHLEEDTGKLQHATVDGKKVTLVDFNRSGVPLVEIVTEADIRSAEQAKEFLKKLHQIVRYLGISDADMEKGSMRLEPNISLRKIGETGLPNYKVEVKNINSFRFASQAIAYEIERHAHILDEGKVPVQETRGWDEGKNATVSQRVKEEAADYRYFPEPDIPPMRFNKETINNVRLTLPELPDVKIDRFMKTYGLNVQDAAQLTESRAAADYFEGVVQEAKKRGAADMTSKKIANWIINKKPEREKVKPSDVVQEILAATTIVRMDELQLAGIVDTAILENPKAAADYKAGKLPSLMFLLGVVMRQVKGKATAEEVQDILKKRLS